MRYLKWAVVILYCILGILAITKAVYTPFLICVLLSDVYYVVRFLKAMKKRRADRSNGQESTEPTYAFDLVFHLFLV